MSSDSKTTPPAGATAEGVHPVDGSCRDALSLLIFGGLSWLTISSILALLTLLKLHMPGFWAACPWVTYGHLAPASTNAFLYGFAIPTGLAACLWLLVQTGRTALVQPGLIWLGGVFWNLGVLLGIGGILSGNSTGFEGLEMSKGPAFLLLCSYILMAAMGLLTFIRRGERTLQPAQWFTLAALFWFPWAYSVANMMLQVRPVRGMAQAVVNWWYLNNIQYVWMALVGLALVFHYVPAWLGRPLFSRSYARFAFWSLLIFGTWGGIPHGAPVPAWVPSLSTVMTVLSLMGVLAVALNLHYTIVGQGEPEAGRRVYRLVVFAAVLFLVASIFRAVLSINSVAEYLRFTTAVPALDRLFTYGFFALAVSGVIYRIVPQITGTAWPSKDLIKAHIFLAVAGLVLYCIPMFLFGLKQGLLLNHPGIGFSEVSASYLTAYRLATLGELVLLLAHLAFLANLKLLFFNCCKKCCLPAIKAAVTAKCKTAEGSA